MSSAGFELAIPAIKQFQTYALEWRSYICFFFKIYCKESMYSIVCSTKDDIDIIGN